MRNNKLNKLQELKHRVLSLGASDNDDFTAYTIIDMTALVFTGGVALVSDESCNNLGCNNFECVTSFGNTNTSCINAGCSGPWNNTCLNDFCTPN
jgi:hypothetical protein